MVPTSLNPGSEIEGYRISSVLGRGGMGVVYLAEQPNLDRKVALKVIAPELAGDEGFRERFLRESRAAAAIDHPNVITVFEARESSDGVLFLAMRYVDGMDMGALISRDGVLPIERAAALLADVASALDEAHRAGLVHRDVKPANILVSSANGVEKAYLTDFGLTKHTASAGGLTGTGQWLGTVDYAAPEQIRGKEVDGRADVYALGCVAFEALTGRIPFDRDNDMAKLWAHVHDPPPSPGDLVKGLPERVDATVTRAMAKDPTDRFGGCGELALAFRGSAPTAAGETVVSSAIAPVSAAAPGDLGAARDAYEQRRWDEAVELLSAADSQEQLGAQDLEHLGEAAQWADRHEESFAARHRAHREYLREGDELRAAFVALMLVIHYAVRFELTAAEGWLAKAERLLEGAPEGPEHGYRALVEALFAEARGEWDAVHGSGVEVHEIGCRHDDPDLQALGLTFQGVVLTRRAEIEQGTRLLDEAMASATGGELGMLATGIVYCRMMCACLDLHDYGRAGEWTDVVETCGTSIGMGGFAGDCRTHRASVMVVRGEWAEAEQEAHRAVEGLKSFNLPHIGLAAYELGAVRLRQGDLDGAEQEFLRAHEHGQPSEPGMSLLRMQRGLIDEAAASIAAALADPALDPLARTRLLPARVEIALASGDPGAARESAAELEELAETYDVPALHAAAEYARAQIEIDAGEAEAAIASLGSAMALWQGLEAPYEAARSRVLLAEAHLARSEPAPAELELRTARAAFERLGAKPDTEDADRRLAALDT